MDQESLEARTWRCSRHYSALVKSGFIKQDRAQLVVLKRLDYLANLIESDKLDKKITNPSWWLTKLKKRSSAQVAIGIYLYGGVGTGKSMLMDIFYDEVCLKKKLRTHFHEFMQDIHSRINCEREKGTLDPISSVAIKISKTVSILCFDEFQITDITDAMIVGRLFSKLIQLGTYIVTTSNRHPDDLYQHGLNRELFLPFIKLFKKKLLVVELNTSNDYRREKLSGQDIFLSPINKNTRESFNKIWNLLVVEPCSSLELRFKSRTIQLPKFCNGVGRSSFNNLCGSALGALDYLMICKHIRVLFIEDIPILNKMQMDSAKRFVILVDTLYENRIKIICLAAEVPERLYTKGKGSFEFERTVSRLYEMQSNEWTS
jgi:cell division protein ZapE